MLKKFFVLIVIDQITKAIFADRDFFFGPLKVALVKNYGLPFGINSANALSLIILFAVFLFFVYYYAHNRKTMLAQENLGFVFIFAGAVSNIIDRLVLGFVRDLFDLRLTFVFNLADAFIVMGIIMIIFSTSFKR